MTHSAVAELYARFGEYEARDVSAIYLDWSLGVAEDPALLELLAALPPAKRQPNLVFAAARLCGAPLGPYDELRTWLLSHWETVVPEILHRSTQTNEAARCAVLLPVLNRLTGPLALIEVGASAGLCLYPDRYSYRYDVDGTAVRLDPAAGPSTLTLPCRLDGPGVPSRLPEVAWRAGLASIRSPRTIRTRAAGCAPWCGPSMRSDVPGWTPPWTSPPRTRRTSCAGT